MQDEIDLEYYVSAISDPIFGIFFAIEDDEPVERIDGDLDSVQEALDNYGKVFLELGYFSYDGSYETSLIFDDNEVIMGLADRYYDKYKFSLAGYGIFLDSDLNVECGYYTTEAPPSGHGAGYTTIHDFKDARKDDVVKEKIYSLLSWTDIENSHAPYHESNHTELFDSKNIIEILQNQLVSIKDTLTSFPNLNIMETDIPQDKLEELEDVLISLIATVEDQLAELKMILYHASFSEHELIKVNKIEREINKIEKETIPNIKQNFCDNLFKRVFAEIDKDYYSSLCKKISDFFSLEYKTNDEILKYLCNNFPKNSVYLFILQHEPHALPANTFDKGLHEGGVLIRLMNGTILTSWNDVLKKSDVEYLIEDLSNETNLSSKYESCTNLISVKLTGMKKDLTDMSRMFYGCNSLADISGLSDLDVSNVSNMKEMFANCRSLVDVSPLGKWDVSNVTDLISMFKDCGSLVDVSGLGKWDVSNVTDLTAMFRSCGSLADVSSLGEWDVSNVNEMQIMFKCTSLADISPLGEWNMSNVLWIMGMFEGCYSLVDISGLSDWDLSSVINMNSMFSGCKSLVDISCLSDWDVSKVKNMDFMFNSCESLVDISALGEWNMSNVKSIRGMFSDCESLVDVSCLNTWDVSNVTDMQLMFDLCLNIEVYPCWYKE